MRDLRPDPRPKPARPAHDGWVRLLGQTAVVFEAGEDGERIRARLTQLTVPAVADRCRVELFSDPRPWESVSPRWMGRAIRVPLACGDRALGTLLLSRTGAPYREADLEAAVTLGRRVGGALLISRLGAKVGRTALRDSHRSVLHAIRQPRTAIYMARGAMSRPDRPEEERLRDAEVVRAAAGRLREMAADLVDFTGLRSGRRSIVWVPSIPTRLLRDVAASFQSDAARRRVRLTLRLDKALPRVGIDERRLAQALEKLLEHALAVTPAGGRVRLEARRAPGGGLRVRVTDTGPEIAPEEEERLFDPFWTSERTPRAGPGLGLALAQAIVQAHGGEIELERGRGRREKGAAFRFTLPIRPPPETVSFPV